MFVGPHERRWASVCLFIRPVHSGLLRRTHKEMISALLIVAFVAASVFFIKWRLNYWQRKGVPYIEPEFFFGNARPQIFGTVSLGEDYLKSYKFFKSLNEKHAGLYLFIDPIYFPLDPDLIKRILTKDFHYFMGHGFYHHPKDNLSMNLFTLEGEKWKHLRAKLTPTFTSGKMKMMFETLVEKTDGLEKLMTQYVDNNEPFAIKDILGRFTTDIIGSCAFGIECNSMEHPDNEFRKYGKKVFDPNILRLIISTLVPWWFLGAIGFKSAGRDVNDFFTNIVKETIKIREVNKIYRKDFMHLLLQLKNQGSISDSREMITKNSLKGAITEDEIIAQCFIFFLAGFETSSTTMTFVLLALAQNPDIQEKLRREINGVLDKSGGQITYDDVMGMPYLDKVINETLRRYPPVSFLPRICSKTYKVPDTDVVIEKGTRVFIPVWGIHMDPEYYPDPERFDPERFNEENKASRPDFTFLPFGEGPRMCIGLRFGVMQSKVGLVSVLRKFRFKINKKTSLPIRMEKASFVLSVKGDVWLEASRV